MYRMQQIRASSIDEREGVERMVERAERDWEY